MHVTREPWTQGYFTNPDGTWSRNPPRNPMHNIPSPRTDDIGIDHELDAKGKTAPRVTRPELDANIVHTEIVTHVTHSGQILRWAILTTKSGFAVTGRPSAAVSSENDDEDIGVRVATENARSELWPLMGYALRERLAEAA